MGSFYLEHSFWKEVEISIELACWSVALLGLDSFVYRGLLIEAKICLFMFSLFILVVIHLEDHLLFESYAAFIIFLVDCRFSSF